MAFLVAPIFGNGQDGDLLIASNTTDAPIDSAFTGTAGSLTGSGTNASFAPGQAVIIHQTQGTNAGQWERNFIKNYTAGTITFSIPLANTYTTGAQILVLKQYRSITINAGATLTAKAWNGTTGGILSYICSGRFINNGTISGTGKGFRGGSTGASGVGQNGEGTGGSQSISRANNGNGGGGGGDFENASAAGGGNGSAGSDGNGNVATRGLGGIAVGSSDLTTISPGGGGGAITTSGGTTAGGNGGALMLFYARMFTNNGTIASNGNAGGTALNPTVASGGGAGGSFLLYTMYGVLGAGTITATAGNGGTGSSLNGGPGAVGRIAIAKGSITDSGTTNPTYYDKGYQTYCGIVGRG